MKKIPKVTAETYADRSWVEFNVKRSENNPEPRVVNGTVHFRKWKITAEVIEEPQEVLATRLQKLWDETKNSHHWEPLRKAARSIGYELQGRPGNKAP